MNKKEAIVAIVAIVLLSIGITSTIYVQSHQVEKGEFIKVANEKIYINDIFNKCKIMNISVDEKGIEKNYEGVVLSDIINMTNLKNKEEHDYTIVGINPDGGTYRKTVSWKDMENGILTKELRTIFPDLRRAFWIKDVIEIEVI